MGPFGPGVATLPEPRGWNERCRLPDRVAQRTVHRAIDPPLAASGGLQRLEVGYDMPVRSTEVVIWGSSGAGFVTVWSEIDAVGLFRRPGRILCVRVR
jgi:hypothetical protein